MEQAMMSSSSSPATWQSEDVVSWAEQAQLGPETISALYENEVDGPTLVTLTKPELRSELGISSLPARRYLWDLIKSLQREHETSDHTKAIQFHNEEIENFANAVSTGQDSGPDAASGINSNMSAVVDQLTSEAHQQKQVLEDHMLALRIQRETNISLQVYEQLFEDKKTADDEQIRLIELLKQAENDRAYAESLLSRRERVAIDAQIRRQVQQSEVTDSELEQNRGEDQNQNHLPSLFGLCIDSCARNKIDVSEAFRSGQVKPIAFKKLDEVDTDEDDDEATSGVQKLSCTEDDRKMPAAWKSSSGLDHIDDESKVPARGKPSLKLECVGNDRKMPAKNKNIRSVKEESRKFVLNRCDVCYDECEIGYSLACGHNQCISCTRTLFKAALGDKSLLPLRCCEIPIDMKLAYDLLSKGEANIITQRVNEIQAKKKMYCPSCSTFINLDSVDSTFSVELLCNCGKLLCTDCKTLAHPGLSCSDNQKIHAANSNEALLELCQENDWKQCPKCSVIIELRHGCNHMKCTLCDHEFCFRCLQEWSTKTQQCSSGGCELWEENRLVEAGELRVQQEEAARGRALPQAEREERLRHAVNGLRANEICVHEWARSDGHKGECPNCGFYMWAYGMQCRSDCGSTVCYTCAHHRIPNQGWH